jgi:pyridoxal 5'-phosphate synthase pdxS subunit
MMTQFEDKAHKVKVGLAEMLKGGVIMDVTTAEQAKIAEASGEGGVARMADLDVIDAIKRAVTIPVMAKCRIGHFIEARVLESIEIDFIDESEVLTPADEKYHVDKWPFKVPFVCGCRNLGEALRRISEGAAMIRTKGEAGTGDVSQAVKHLREIGSAMKSLTVMSPEEHYGVAKEYRVPLELVKVVAQLGKLPVPNFAAGGIATPADAALCMHLGAEAVFVGSGIFKSSEDTADQEKLAKAIVSATTHWKDFAIIAEYSHGIAKTMKGQAVHTIPVEQQLQTR